MLTPASSPVDEKDENPHRRRATAEVKAYRAIPGVYAQKQKKRRQPYQLSSALGARPTLARHSSNIGTIETNVIERGTDFRDDAKQTMCHSSTHRD